ncbi:hypothetical protein K493DRAFT_381211 [Basidiobolus meristosporus CBS 931.73]|uniref:Methyltransferase domain-containing protein n=1 Tax=Basidiobolus meristosporus CBS 931.73 TaxID=1314790 RepID=A0A1Y1XWL8_9FUNG|nr:hypothetical protein K493DRAFT_381211 [Basidiobolus meristosporus CBS 931.73]|eukprot:ORX90149.1 hypothetical protein K493DRAFT_381211 [Basidiobolus meristosporus CBS 931.73]
MTLSDLPNLHSSSDYYAQAFSLFRHYSDQKQNVKRWYLNNLTPLAQKYSRLSVLSIGCGNGDVDGYLIREIFLTNCAHTVYHGVEPSRAHRYEFLDKMRSASSSVTVGYGENTPCGINVDSCVSESIDMLLFDTDFETFVSSQVAGPTRYDIIIAGHSLYYLKLLAPALDSIFYRLLASRGCLTIIHTTPADFQCTPAMSIFNEGQPRTHVQILREVIKQLGPLSCSGDSWIPSLSSEESLVQVQINDLYVDVSCCLAGYNKDRGNARSLLSFFHWQRSQAGQFGANRASKFHLENTVHQSGARSLGPVAAGGDNLD